MAYDAVREHSDEDHRRGVGRGPIHNDPEFNGIEVRIEGKASEYEPEAQAPIARMRTKMPSVRYT